MKRFFIAFAAVITVVLSFNTFDAEARKPKKPKAVWKSDEQIWAEDPERTEPRAWAFRQGNALVNLEVLAAEMARAELAAQTCVLVSRAIEIYTEEKTVGETDKRGNTDDISLMKDKVVMQVNSAAKELIKGSRIAKSTRYEADKEGHERCYVGVEVTKDDIILNIMQTKEVKDALDQLESTIVGDDSKFEIGSDDFKSSSEKAFQELKEGKLNASDL